MDWLQIILPIAAAVFGMAAKRLGIPNPFDKTPLSPVSPAVPAVPGPAPSPVAPSERPILDAVLKWLRDELDRRLPRLPVMEEPKLFMEANGARGEAVVSQRMGNYVVTIRPQVEVSLADDHPPPEVHG